MNYTVFSSAKGTMLT